VFENLGQMMQPQGGQQQQSGQQLPESAQSKTLANLGMLIMSGASPQDAYTLAAKMTHDQETVDAQRQKQEVRQQQAHTAAQILQNGGGLAEMLAAGINDPGILGALPQPQYITNPHEPGGGSFKYPGLRGQGNPIGQGGAGGQGNMQPSQGTQNGMMPPQQVPVQDMNMGNRMPVSSAPFVGNTPAEMQANIDVQKKAAIETNKNDEKFDEVARHSFVGAQESKRLLNKLNKAYESYDKKAPRYIKPGSFLANTTNLPFLNAGQTRAILHGDKTINETAEINKIGTELQTKLLQALESAKAAGNVYLEKRLEAGLPDLGAPKKAREKIVENYRDVIAISDLIYKAREPWKKLGNGRNGDVVGLVEFIMKGNNDTLVNRKGELDDKILKNLPEYIEQYKAYKENPGMDTAVKQTKPLSPDEFNALLQDEGFLNYRQQQGSK